MTLSLAVRMPRVRTGSAEERRSSSIARRSNSALKSIAVPVASFAVAIIAWYVVTYAVLAPERRFLLPAPHRVLTGSLADWSHLRPMLEALAVTARVTACGFVIAVLFGLAVGILMNQARWIERAVYPYAVVLQVIPILAIVPLIGLWFGYGMVARIIVCVMIAAFPIITNTHFGLQSVDRGLHELFTLGRASRWERLTKLELRAALPAIMTGVRTAAGLVVVGAIIGDMFFAKGQPGIGTLLDVYRSRLQSEDLIAAIAIASAFGIAVFSLFGVLSRALVGKWHASGSNS
ncbi:ABC transporter permease [Rhodococcus sp. IEGM 1401]|uniref:ABC transporter permease n=1 Tax=unclassified Rhodococcus (in: high G+C Gram-positive bacteria) TaxID=192944 RepID=UPI0022B4A1D4|nr:MULTISPECIES: ABC transporter permease [unclassified Rhodococcus (in: high G+C Gram-positive bacteria)]MCZ4563918.1 ABC transporter permease [Rhodococcus sp. IEGM 1401]MDI9924040.1 ABC transporter permease [Rhodococcus sp. IEGM 1372]MDV8036507.1 ABC transporter permease [Rhodococcus sp. IEGM 1414]